MNDSMDFLDPKKRKAHRIRLYIGYGLMAIALAFATTVLLYQAYGYDYDPKTGEIVQNGFIFVNSSPVSASITLNGRSEWQTDTRIDTAAGEYDIELNADGYRTWKQSFTLEGGKIERLTHPFLFPNDLVSSDVQLYATAPAFISQSPDNRWLLANQPGSFVNYDLIDDNVDAPTADTLSLPNGLLKTTGANHKVSVMEWSTDNRHVLMRHEFDGGLEFFLLDIESPGSSVNLTDELATKATFISLRDKKFDQYYLYDAVSRTLTTSDLRTQTALPYLTDVLEFQPHGDDVMLFVSPTGASEGKTWIKLREGNDTFNLREIPLGDKYLVDIARFENNWYIAAGADKDQRVYIFKNPVAATKRSGALPVPAAVLRSSTLPQFVSFSKNARFIAVQSGREFSVYDAETDRQYRYQAAIEAPAGYEALWMDGHRLSLVSKQKVVVFDFDGTNLQELSPAVDNAQVYFNQDWESMFVLSPSQSVPGRLSITSTSLRANP